MTRGFSNGPGSQQSFLRGLPGVRTYFAEVPYRITGPGTFFDLQNVQALTGPQGTLFGLNATGGAILLEPKKPTNNYEASADLLLGSYNWRRITSTVNIPIVPSMVANNIAEGGTVSTQNPNVGNAQIVLNTHAEATFQIPDVTKVLAVPDLLRVYMEPAVIAIAEKVETDLLNLYASFTANTPLGTPGAALT